MTNADFSSSVTVPIKLLSEGGREQIKDAYENFDENIKESVKEAAKDAEKL